uniref:class I SAM-dependent methyltransferase n=1 Tax=uncultured Altererythrobacter sp. TaxID=500840 RepID=UPI002615530A|nr:class I SAM-dependent methyltransferase [uncultured Altererythrobacter sp.]
MLGPEFEQIQHTIGLGGVRDPEHLLKQQSPSTVLDLGCGDGRAVELVRSIGASYTGVDIEASPEVRARTRSDASFVSYDGQNLPFKDSSFDLVYSRQVFEHVRHPDQVAAEVQRVLKPGGKFIASLSYLEPYHSFSIFNFTPYGVYRLIEDNGLKLEAMWPGADGLSLIVRQLTNRRMSKFPVIYPMIDLIGTLASWDARKRNYLKLRFAGHITLQATKS